MIFNLKFKTNDVLDQLDNVFENEEQLEEAKEFAKQFVKYGEYITIVFDTEKQTATARK